VGLAALSLVATLMATQAGAAEAPCSLVRRDCARPPAAIELDEFVVRGQRPRELTVREALDAAAGPAASRRVTERRTDGSACTCVTPCRSPAPLSCCVCSAPAGGRQARGVIDR
jgi:hypothetical protein